MKITIIKKAEVKKTDVSICPWIVEGLPQAKK